MPLILTVCPSTASAHTGPSGARVDQEVTVTLGKDAIAVTYATQLNRPAAFLEVLRMDRNGDGTLSPHEQQHYFGQLQEKLLGGLEVNVNGKQVVLEQIGQMELSMPFRKLFRFQVGHPPGWEQGAVVEVHNDNYLDFAGVITVDLDPGSEADVVYDSRWGDEAAEAQAAAMAAGSPSNVQQRDVVFRYRRGSGRHEPLPEADETAFPAAASHFSVAALPRGHGRIGMIPALIPALALLVGACAAALAVVRARAAVPQVKVAGVTMIGLVACLTAAASLGSISWETSSAAVPSKLEAGQIFQKLHAHIYRAFDARTESELYDTLAEALDGEVLDEVYNEVYEALMARGTGATRFRVRRVKPIATAVLPMPVTIGQYGNQPAFRVRYRWRVYGTVTHFGHTHARFNEYEAVYTVTLRVTAKHNGRAWRISGSQVRQNRRVSIGLS